MDEFFEAIEKAALEYKSFYKVELDKKIANKNKLEEQKRAKQMEKFKRDLKENKGQKVLLKHKKKAVNDEDEEDEEMQDEEIEDQEDVDTEEANEQMELESFRRYLSETEKKSSKQPPKS